MSDTKTSELNWSDKQNPKNFNVKQKKYYSVWIHWDRSLLKEFGLFKVLWGTDIWINGWPMLKILVLANIVVWIVMFLTR